MQDFEEPNGSVYYRICDGLQAMDRVIPPEPGVGRPNSIPSGLVIELRMRKKDIKEKEKDGTKGVPP